MLRKFHCDEKGQAMVELALILPVLLMLLLGIIEFGRMYNAYLVIDHATREGARLGSTGAADSEIIAKINSLTSTLPQSSSMAVYISPVQANRVRGQDISVKANYSFTFIAPLIGDIVGNPLTLTSNVIMRLE